MKPLIRILSCFALAVTMYGCNKADNSSSEPTEYFNCKIDGRDWSYAECDACLIEVDALHARPEKFDLPHFEIYAKNNEPSGTVFEFSLDTAAYRITDTIQLNSHNASYCTVFKPYGLEPTNSLDYETVKGSTGQLVFTEKTSSIVRGTFQFDATNGNKVIHITEGKFKIKL